MPRARGLGRLVAFALGLGMVVPEVAAALARYEYSHRKGRDRIEVTLVGTATLTDDGAGLASLAPGSTFVGREQDAVGITQVFIHTDAQGELVHRFERDGVLVEDDEEAQAWLAGLIRRSPLAPAMRAREYLARGGPSTLLGALTQDLAEQVKGSYLLELAGWEPLELEDARGLPESFTEFLAADTSLGSALAALAKRFRTDSALTLALLRATEQLQSVASQESILRTIIAERRMDLTAAKMACELIGTLASSSAQEGLLRSYSRRQPGNGELTRLLVRAATRIPAQPSRESALVVLAQRRRLDIPGSLQILQAASALEGDSSKARVLADLSKTMRQDDLVLAALLEESSSLGSVVGRERVLASFLEREDLTPAALQTALQMTEGLSEGQNREALKARVESLSSRSPR